MENRWAIAWTSIFISAIWIFGPVAWVVHKSSAPSMTWFNFWFWVKTSLQYKCLFPVAFIPFALDLGLIMAWWIWPKIVARRDQEVQRLKQGVYRQESLVRNMGWDLEKQKVQNDSQCQIKLQKALETIKAWEREARAKIEAWEGAVKRRRQILEEEIAEQRQAANEKQEKLKKREEELGAQEKDFEARLVRLDRRQAELEVLRSELTDREQNFHDWERDLDERERSLMEKEQTMEIPEEATVPVGPACEPGRANDNQAVKDDLPEGETSDQASILEEKIWKILSGRQEMKKRDLERKINKSRYEQYWETAISSLLISGKIIYDADSNSYSCQHVLFQ